VVIGRSTMGLRCLTERHSCIDRPPTSHHALLSDRLPLRNSVNKYDVTCPVGSSDSFDLGTGLGGRARAVHRNLGYEMPVISSCHLHSAQLSIGSLGTFLASSE
jgi:hypothetical protein